MKKNITKFICINAVIAGLYVLFTMPFGIIAVNSNLQFRPAEALTILPALCPYTVVGLTIGCAIANTISPFGAFDIVLGSAVTLIAGLNKLKKIPFKKPDNTAVAVEYMSMAAITAIIEQPDATTSKGLRDRFFMILLYDTGARVQEMLNIRLSDIQLGPLPKVTLFGKGRKTRVVPLMEKTAQHLKKYLLEFHADNVSEEDVTLFYSVIRGEKHPLTSRTAQYLLQKYGEQARQVCKEIPPNVHPHLFRHSRAMHLYQEGMDLTLISQWLGHSQLETTQIYAHADTEHKRRAIEASTPQDNPLYSKLNSARYTVTDEEMLKKLTGLR